jgi:hypothetical protein
LRAICFEKFSSFSEDFEGEVWDTLMRIGRDLELENLKSFFYCVGIGLPSFAKYFFFRQNFHFQNTKEKFGGKKNYFAKE